MVFGAKNKSFVCRVPTRGNSKFSFFSLRGFLDRGRYQGMPRYGCTVFSLTNFFESVEKRKTAFDRMVVDADFFMDLVELKILLPRDFPAGCLHNAYPSIPAFEIYFEKFGEQGVALVFDIYDSDSPDESTSSEFLLRKIFGSCGFQLL